MNALEHGCWIRAAFTAAIIAVAPAAAHAGEIRVWPTAAVEDEHVLLADIAELRGFDPATTEALARTVIQTTPRAGGEWLILADDLREVLSESGANLSEIAMFGASRCRVSRLRSPDMEDRPKPSAPAPIINPPKPRPERKPIAHAGKAPVRDAAERPSGSGTLEHALRDYIAARSSIEAGRLEIRFSPASADALRLTTPPYRFVIRQRGEQRLGLLSFEVDAVENGDTARTIPVVAEVALLREVVVARRPINRGETIDSRSLKLEERRFTDPAAIGMTEPSAAVGRQSRGFLKPGEMLTAREVEDKPIVNRGQPVTIWMRRGGLVIRASGKAQQAGGLGDRIEVMRDGTHRTRDMVEAIVTGPGTVSVDTATQVAFGSEVQTNGR